MSKPATLRCFGAVHNVTGSMHLIEANGDRILLDCGLSQGRREEARALIDELVGKLYGLTEMDVKGT